MIGTKYRVIKAMDFHPHCAQSVKAESDETNSQINQLHNFNCTNAKGYVCICTCVYSVSLFIMSVGVGNNVTHKENSRPQSFYVHVREVIKEQILDIFEHHISQIAQTSTITIT